jgi:hypothetical protein
VTDFTQFGATALGPAEEGSTKQTKDLDDLDNQQKAQEKYPRIPRGKQRKDGEGKRTYSNKGRL